MLTHSKMTGLNFDGDLSQISEQQLKYIKSVIEKLGYSNSKVSIQPLGIAGDNYVANVKRITIEDGKGGTLNIVAKVAPTNEQMREMVHTKLLFHNEHVMYTKVLPKFTELEIAAEIPPQDRLRYAKCYGSSDEAPNEVILLEDLGDSQFKMMNRLESLSNDCVKLILKNFAKIHSLSYALKHKEPAVWDELKNELFNMWAAMEKIDQVLTFTQQMEMNAANIVESDIHKKSLKGAVSAALKDLSKMAGYEGNTKHSVIQQGDCWTNNVMFRLDAEEVAECIMIDYQLSKPTSPVADLLYMIFNCTNYELRKEHFYDWIDYYHSELDRALSEYGLKANFVFPRDQLDADLKRYGKSMFGLSMMLAGTLSLNVEEAAKMKQMMENADMEAMANMNNGGITETETKQIFKKRIEGIVDSFHELGLL